MFEVCSHKVLVPLILLCCQCLFAAGLAFEEIDRLSASCVLSVSESHESVSLLQLGARPLRNAVDVGQHAADALIDGTAVKAAQAELQKIEDLRRGWGQGQAIDHQHGELAFFSGAVQYMDLHRNDYPSVQAASLEPNGAEAHGQDDTDPMERALQEGTPSDDVSSVKPHTEILVQETTFTNAIGSKAISEAPSAKVSGSTSATASEASFNESKSLSFEDINHEETQDISGPSASSMVKRVFTAATHGLTDDASMLMNKNVSGSAPLLEFLSDHDSGTTKNASTPATKSEAESPFLLDFLASSSEHNVDVTDGTSMLGTKIAKWFAAQEEEHPEKQEGPYCQAVDVPDEGFDREGGDLLARPVNGSVSSCIEKCCNTAGCVAYVYARAPSNYGSCKKGNLCCYLKSEVTEKKQSEYDSVATGLVRRRTPRAGLSNQRHTASSHSLMDVVGQDGVLKIALEIRPEWESREDGHVVTEGEGSDYQNQSLTMAGIAPAVFNATDANTASEAELNEGCRLDSDPNTQEFCAREKKDGSGCKSRVESAIAASHRRALLAAQARTESDWTLIMEDDVVPVNPADWNAAFQEAWPKLPAQYKMIRLGWCTFEEDLGELRKTSDVDDAGLFHLNNWMSWRDQDGGDHYYSGGCTTAYMVHREMIPELLGIFPCCCPLDCCLEDSLYYQPTNEPNLFRGQQVVTNMDTNNTEEYSHLFTFFNQSGVLVQDNRQMRSTRPEYNRTAFLEMRPRVERLARNRELFTETA